MPFVQKTATTMPLLMEQLNAVLRSKRIPLGGLPVAGLTLTLSSPAQTCVFSDGETAAVLLGTALETFNIPAGSTMLVAVDGGGADTATFDAAAGTLVGTGLAIVDLDGDTLSVDMNNTGVQVITFTAAATTAQLAVDEINAVLTGGTAEVDGGQVRITSSIEGTDSEVDITAGTALTELGLSVTSNSGTGDFADASVATAAEIVTVLTADVSGATSADVGGYIQITSDTTGVSSDLQVTAGTVQALLGLPTALYRGAVPSSGLLSLHQIAAELNAALNGDDVYVTIDPRTHNGTQAFVLVFSSTVTSPLTFASDSVGELFGFKSTLTKAQIAETAVKEIGMAPSGFFAVYWE